MIKIGNEWDEIVKGEYEKNYFQKLINFIEEEQNTKTIYPEKENIYNALKLVPPDKVKVVILGQDPYINKGQAHGLSFSVQDGITIPPSLRNIYKELESDLAIAPASFGNLTKWAEQGVLLLNTTLTVRSGSSKCT